MRGIGLISLVVVWLSQTTAGLAFSLLGPSPATGTTNAALYWQTPILSYNTLGTAIGGPVKLGEEYRWNVPLITYGFDDSFEAYFGQPGVDAVEAAIATLNNLPAVSALNVNDYPADSRRANFQALSLNLLDLKSVTLSLLLEQLGLTTPERFVWTLRERRVFEAVPGLSPATTNYFVIQRNFDPVTLNPTSTVNGTIYTYHIQEFTAPSTYADALEVAVDTLAPANTAVAGRPPGNGEFYTGLTSDDVGGLRYLLNPTNLNVEPLLPGVVGTGSNATAFVNTAPRHGVDRIAFLRLGKDSLTGDFIPFTNSFVDHYATNDIVIEQTLQRVVIHPDILFSAQALGMRGNSPKLYERTGTTSWRNNATLNGSTNAGPGVVQPPIQITFNKLGRYLAAGSNQMTDTNYVFPNWGSFNGSTNLVVFAGNETNLVSVTLNATLQTTTETNVLEWTVLAGRDAVYRVDTSTDLTNWQPLLSITNSTGIFRVADTNDLSKRFYRVLREKP